MTEHLPNYDAWKLDSPPEGEPMTLDDERKHDWEKWLSHACATIPDGLFELDYVAVRYGVLTFDLACEFSATTAHDAAAAFEHVAAELRKIE